MNKIRHCHIKTGDIKTIRNRNWKDIQPSYSDKILPKQTKQKQKFINADRGQMWLMYHASYGPVRQSIKQL